MTLIVPDALPLKLAEQVAALPLPPPRVQLVLVGDTPAPLAVKLTVPEGVIAPEVEVSVTVAVQLLDPPTNTGLAQLTLVVVVCNATVIEPLPELLACVASPG